MFCERENRIERRRKTAAILKVSRLFHGVFSPSPDRPVSIVPPLRIAAVSAMGGTRRCGRVKKNPKVAKITAASRV